MRISVIEQVKIFLRNSKVNNKYVFCSKEMKLTIKNYLVKQKMLYSPIRGIYILKKSDQFTSDILEKYKYQVLEQIWGVITWDFAIAYYLGDYSGVKSYKIITETKSFSSTLWEKILLQFQASSVPRKINEIKIEESSLKIESPLSLYINDYKNIPENSPFIRYLMSLDITRELIIEMINKKCKTSGISKLAQLYKVNGFPGKQKTILNTLREAGKQIDYRKATTQVKVSTQTPSTSFWEDLDSLI